MNTRPENLTYAEAVKRQEELRDGAFLDLPFSLCGFPCLKLTARHFAILVHSRSPFVCGGFPLPEHVVQFLWVLHPKFSYTDIVRRDAFIDSCAWLDYDAAVQSIVGYVEEVMIDSPATGGNRSEGYHSWLAVIVDTLAREYGWSQEQIMSLPMASLFQYLRLIGRRNGDTGPQFNRLTDAAKNRWLEKVNAENAAKAAAN